MPPTAAVGIDTRRDPLAPYCKRPVPVTLESTNACESTIEIVRRTQRNIKHWSSGEMGLRWTAASLREAAKQFRKLIGYTDLPRLAIAIEHRLHLHQPNPAPTQEAAIAVTM